jgi:small subunit ribosomal protein S2
VIACNDDALKSIKLILSTLTQAIIDKKNDMLIPVSKGDEQQEMAEEELEKIEEGESPGSEGEEK